MGQLIKVNVRFFHGASGKPVGGAGLRVRLLDKDVASDDLLGEAALDSGGAAEFIADLGDAGSGDSPLETRPDLFVQLVREGVVVYQSTVTKDVDFLARDPVSGERQSLTVDLGTLRV